MVLITLQKKERHEHSSRKGGNDISPQGSELQGTSQSSPFPKPTSEPSLLELHSPAQLSGATDT